MSGSSLRSRFALTERLRERFEEIEAALLTRVYAIADPSEARDPQYVEGLRAAVSSALRYALAGIERGDPRPGAVPAELFTQARHAAGSKVSLDTVLRRYMAGHALLTDFTFKAAEEANLLGHSELRRLLGVQAALLDHLVAEISEEYRREVSLPARSVERARAERVRRILDGEPLDPIGLNYELGGWHIGAVAEGPGAEEGLRELARATDLRILNVRPGRGALWVWLGGSRRVETDAVLAKLAADRPEGASVALGEPGEGIEGWRLTHRQALAALPVARRSGQALVGYAGVVLLASILGDELLAASLRRLYLAPLSDDSARDADLCRTLAAYFASECNVSSTAASLAVDRKTVTRRLRAAERRLGRTLSDCAPELQIALRLQELEEARE